MPSRKSAMASAVTPGKNQAGNRFELYQAQKGREVVVKDANGW
jgi:hypothetical protein